MKTKFKEEKTGLFSETSIKQKIELLNIHYMNLFGVDFDQIDLNRFPKLVIVNCPYTTIHFERLVT